MPATDRSGTTGTAPRFTGRLLGATLAAGFAWGLYNAAIAMVFGFGPLVLAERGLSGTEASARTSLMLWLMVVSVPLGGLLADAIGRPALLAPCAGLRGNWQHFAPSCFHYASAAAQCDVSVAQRGSAWGSHTA